MRKIIITQRIDQIKEYKELRESLDTELPNLLVHLGYLVFPISNTLLDKNDKSNTNLLNQPKLVNFLEEINPDGIVLSGGNDIGQYPFRDQIEFLLLEWAESQSKPVLGICRGMQIMAVKSGSKLVKIKGHVNEYNYLYPKVKKDLIPHKIKCFHNWGLQKCPENFSILANTEDGYIEAIRHSKLPWEGWMWHPERDSPVNDLNKKRIKGLFQ